VLNSCVEVRDRDVSRSKEFRSQCASCQGEMNMEGSMENIECSLAEENTVTPSIVSFQPQVEGSSDNHGQWTLVVNKKKSKLRLNHEGDNLEH
jgi:hypothetical protein